MEENKSQEVVPENQEAKVESNVPAKEQVEAKVDSNNTQVPKEDTKANSEKKKSKAKVIVTIVILVLIAAVVAVYFLVFARKTIDLSEFIDVEYHGYDGYAYADVSISKDLKKYLDDSSLYKKFVEKVEMTVKDNENLSNDDEIEIKVKISETWLKNNKLKLKDNKVTVKVKDLEKAEVVDVFEGIEVEITGISPNLNVSVNNNNSDSFIRTVSYYTSESSGLSNGDVITITANYNSYTAEEQGVVVAKDTMEYKIENQPEYVMSASELKEDILNVIKPELQKKVKEEADNNSSALVYHNYNQDYGTEYSVSEPELVNMYLLTIKDSSNSFWSDTNKLYGIYKVVFTSKANGQNFDWYFVANTYDIAIDVEGKLKNKDELKYNVSTRWNDGKTEEEAYNDLISDEKTNYIIEKIEK